MAPPDDNLGPEWNPSSPGAILAEIRTNVANIKDNQLKDDIRYADHETRIRNLERTVWRAAGFAGAVSAVATAVVSFVVQYLANR